MADSQVERRGRLYGRKWKIVIYKPAYKKGDKKEMIKERDPENDIEIDVSLLRCIFSVSYTAETQAWLGTLVVYNMNATAEGDIIEEGFQIRIEAGYDEGQYGEIFTGDIVQIIRNRENGIDYRLEILAMKGTFFDYNFTRCSLAAGSTPRDIVYGIEGWSRQRIVVGEVSDNLKQQALPRGKVLFGTPAKYLRDITIGNDAFYWAGEDGKLEVRKVDDEIPADNVLVLSPGNLDKNEPNLGGLVGTPQYGDDGIHIKMLMDCRVKLLSLIKIDNEIIRRQFIQPNLSGKGQNQSQVAQFDKDGEYQVFKVTHRGDTHGDDWLTEVLGIGRNGRVGGLVSELNKEGR